MAERIVIVQGDGPEWLIDLEKNPGIKQRVEVGELRVIKELKSLPPDPWAKTVAKQAAREAEPPGGGPGKIESKKGRRPEPWPAQRSTRKS